MTVNPNTTARRPRAAVPIDELPRKLRADADELSGWGAGNEAERVRQAADEIERLQRVLDSRPAINAGLPDSYVRWSQSIYVMEHARAQGEAQ